MQQVTTFTINSDSICHSYLIFKALLHQVFLFSPLNNRYFPDSFFSQHNLQRTKAMHLPKQAQGLNKAKGTMPFQIVEKPWFFRLMKKAVPQYKVQSRSYFSSNKVPAHVQGGKSLQCEGTAGRGCLWFGATTDCGDGGEAFMSFTVHYISSDWKLKSHCLGTLYFLEDPTAEHLKEMMENMPLEWKIKKERRELKQKTTVTWGKPLKHSPVFGFLVLIMI